MIPNEASCPVFSFTFRRKSVVDLHIERSKIKEKKNARVYFFFSVLLFLFTSFPLFAVSFCRVFRFCAATPIMIFDQFGELQNADACDFADKKKTRADRPVRACSRPTERERVHFSYFSQK